MVKQTTMSRDEIQAKIKELQAQLSELVRQLAAIQSNRVRIFNTAVSLLGVDASPSDLAPDELGCAETVNAVVEKALGFQVGGGLSTNLMYKALLKSSKFIRVDQGMPGDILISPTGYGNGGLSNGHVGIVGENNTIMSNSSKTGTFESNYTIKAWADRYFGMGGYPMAFFRAV